MSPLFEYECPECNKQLELIQKFDDPNPLCSCQKTNSPTMERQMSRSGAFVLKGSGWYRDGYQKKSK